MPVSKGPLINHIIPSNWAWAWKLLDESRAKGKNVYIAGDCFEICSTMDVVIRGLDLKSPTLEREGTRIWLLPGADRHSLWWRLNKLPGSAELSAGQIIMDTEGRADLFIPHPAFKAYPLTKFGFGLATFHRIKGDKIDLTSLFTYSGPFTNNAISQNTAQIPSVSVRTNAFVATRIQFPTNSFALILAPNKSGATNRCIALILTAERR
jgi:hypothetical protein